MKPAFLLVIPARGGSKGIPGKNVVLINECPLIKFSIDVATEVAEEMRGKGYIFDILVSSDDEEILEVASHFNVLVVKRPPELANDDVPLDPVIIHAFKFMEGKNKTNYDVVITMQPTSPLLKPATLKEAVEIFCKKKGKINTLVTVTEERHLFWRKQGDTLMPLYQERRNRQWLEPFYKETGGLVFSDRETILKGKRFGDKVEVFVVPFPESVDIDSWTDLVLVENYLRRQKIAIRVDGDFSIGLGHVYRAITLTRRLWAHDVRFFMNERCPLGIDKVRSYNFNVFTFSKEEELFAMLEEYSPHVVINDILDTSRDYIKRLKSYGCRVVNFEDLGEGALYADAVINALYEWSGEGRRFFYGYRYECLREDCYYFPPRKDISKRVKKILVTFGGTDINKTTLKVLSALERAEVKDAEIKVIEGIGFQYEKELNDYVTYLNQRGYSIVVIKDVKLMAPLIREADLVISSNGRTVYEVASMAVPLIVISQNSREATHLFSKVCNGIVNLGIASELDVDVIKAALEDVIGNEEKRKRMHMELLEYAGEIRKGVNRVIKIILNGSEHE